MKSCGRCLFPSKGSFLRFSDHSFSAEDVDESLRDQFVLVLLQTLIA